MLLEYIAIAVMIAVAGGLGRDEELQVEGEVKARHGHKRHAPGQVQNRDPPLRLH